MARQDGDRSIPLRLSVLALSRDKSRAEKTVIGSSSPYREVGLSGHNLCRNQKKRNAKNRGSWNGRGVRRFGHNFGEITANYPGRLKDAMVNRCKLCGQPKFAVELNPCKGGR